MKDKMINHLKVAMGTASYCKTCKALMIGGVNNPEVAKSLGIKGPRAWYKFLKDHEAYHTAKGEELPALWTVAGLSEEMLAKCTAPIVMPVAGPKRMRFPHPTLNEYQEALMSLKRAASTPKRLMNKRQDNRPIVKPLDPTPFAGL